MWPKPIWPAPIPVATVAAAVEEEEGGEEGGGGRLAEVGVAVEVRLSDDFKDHLKILNNN